MIASNYCEGRAPARPHADLPKSEILARRVFVSETPAKGDKPAKVMVHKFLVWKTNKEGADPRFPTYVYHHTDYSSGRGGGKEGPFKRQVFVSSDQKQIMALMEAGIVDSVMSAPKDGGAPTLKRGWKEA